MKLKNRGFTLIQMLIVVVIVGLLATLARTALRTSVSDAKTAKLNTAVQRVEQAKLQYYLDNPTASPTLTPPLASLVKYLNIPPAIGINAFYNRTGSLFENCYKKTESIFLSPNAQSVKPTYIIIP